MLTICEKSIAVGIVLPIICCWGCVEKWERGERVASDGLVAVTGHVKWNSDI